MKIIFTICLTLVLIFCFSVIAFADYTIEIIIDPAEGGTAQGAGNYKTGKNAELSVTPSPGYTFEGWYKDGDTEPVVKETSFLFEGEADRKYTAKFLPALTITVSADIAEGGTVSQSGTGNYKPDETVTLTAVTANGYTFSGWFDALTPATPLNTDMSYSFPAQESKNIIGKFTPSFELDVAAVPIDGGTVSGSGTYGYGKTATIAAIPEKGYKFVGWFPPDNSGEPLSTEPEYKLNMDANASVIARFEKKISDNAIKTIVIIAIGAAIVAMAIFFIKKKNTTTASKQRRRKKF